MTRRARSNARSLDSRMLRPGFWPINNEEDMSVAIAAPFLSRDSAPAVRRDVEHIAILQRADHFLSQALQPYIVPLLTLEGRPAGRLLEVGCGAGHLAALARRRGWRVTGLDGSAEAVSEAAVHFGLEVRGGTLARHRETLAPQDVVLIHDNLAEADDRGRLV